MSLDFNVTKIKGYDNTSDDGIGYGPSGLSPVTHSIVFACLTTGIGEITERTASEFWARICLYEKLEGAFLSTPDGPRPFTMEDVYNHIGLTTNVFPEETRAKWMSRIIKARLEQEKTAFHRFASSKSPELAT